MEEQTNSENYSSLLENRENKIKFYENIRKYFIRPFIRRYLDVKVIGQEKITKNNPCIFVTHHCLYFDGILFGAIFDKKIHGWIAENVFLRRKGLYEHLELIPVKTSAGIGRDGRNEIMKAYQRTKDLSLFWLRNTFDAVGINEGLAECCLNESGKLISLEERKSHAGAANLAYEADLDPN